MLGWRVKSRGSETRVLLYGELSEVADFGNLRQLRGRVMLDLAGIKQVNSIGVRELLGFLDGLGRQATIVAERCSPPVVAQLNMLPELSAKLPVRSVLVPLECPLCLGEQQIAIPIARGATAIEVPGTRCEDCGAEMELAEPPERYFAFLDAC